MRELYAAAYKGALKSAWFFPVGLVLNWWVWAPLYSTHSRVWDFVLMTLVVTAHSLLFPAFMAWWFGRKAKKRGWL